MEPAGLAGVGDAAKRFEDLASGYDGKSLFVIALTGPPGSGRTTLAKHVFNKYGFIVHYASTDESPAKEASRILSFCSTKGSVDALISTGGNVALVRSRRAVFLDNNFQDAKMITSIVDCMKKSACKVLVVASLNRSTKTVSARRRTDVVLRLEYPSFAQAVSVVKKLRPSAPSDGVRRCVRSAGMCIPKALSLLEGERYGTVATEPEKLSDCTIFDEVRRAVELSDDPDRYTLLRMEVAISTEPSLCVFILRDALAGPKCPKKVYSIFNWFVSIPPGDQFVPLAAATAFKGMLMATEHRPVAYKFPSCYTVMSSRSTALKRSRGAA